MKFIFSLRNKTNKTSMLKTKKKKDNKNNNSIKKIHTQKPKDLPMIVSLLLPLMLFICKDLVSWAA